MRIIFPLFLMIQNYCLCDHFPEYSDKYQAALERLHLLVLRKKTGSPGKIVHYAQSVTDMHPVCFDTSCIPVGLEMAAFELCRKQGFPTSTASQLTNARLFSGGRHKYVHAWNTSYSQLNETNCDIAPADMKCTHFLQIECGVCQFSLTVREKQEIRIRSPLYPVLPSGLNCIYDIFANKKVKIHLEELNLDPAVNQYKSSSLHNEGNCLDSFLQIETNVEPVSEVSTGVYTFCGNMSNKIITTNGKHIRLRLVTGTKRKLDLSGFVISIASSPKNGKTVELVIVVIGILAPVLCFACIFFSHMFKCGTCKKVGPRRPLQRQRRQLQNNRNNLRSTWVGILPGQGETIHEHGTRRLQRFVESDENRYVMDNRVSARSSATARPLPEVPVSTATTAGVTSISDNNNNNNDEKQENISVQSSSLNQIYQTLSETEERKCDAEHVYLSLVRSGEYTDQSCSSKFQDQHLVSEQVEVTNNLVNSYRTSSRVSSTDQHLEHLKNSGNAENDEGRGTRRGLDCISSRMPSTLTPIKFVKDVSPGWTRRLSEFGSRVASLASYASITREPANSKDESICLLDEENASMDAESDDEVFRETSDVQK